jgi:hypothetical protein
MFIRAMKAQDSTIKCGVGFDTGNSSYNTAVLGQTGTNADFVIIHWYPGGDAPTLLTTPGQIGSIVNNTRTQLTNNVGAALPLKWESPSPRPAPEMSPAPRRRFLPRMIF